MAYVNSTSVVRVTLLDRAFATVTLIRAAIERRAIYRQTLCELNALSDRDLADMGLMRGNIEEVAKVKSFDR